MPRPADQRNDRSTSAVPHAGDLAVAGAIPATFVATPAIAEGGIPTASSISAKSAATAGNSSDQSHDIAGLAALAVSGGLVAPAVSLAAAPVVPTVTGPAPAPTAHAAMIAPFVPMPQGAGAPDMIAMGQAASAPLPDLAVPDQHVPDAVQAVAATPTAAIDIAALDAVRTSVATLQESLAALADRLPDATAAVQPTLDAAEALVTQTLGGVQDQVGKTIAAVTATVDATTDRIADDLGDTLASVGAVTTALTAPILDQIAATADTVENVVAPIAQTVTTTVTDAVEHTGDIIQPVTALLDEGFAGADPATGITTLVGMVSAADAFGLHDAATGDGEAMVPALGVLGAADLLADIAPVDALLGVNDHHETHGLADLDGLFGHG